MYHYSGKFVRNELKILYFEIMKLNIYNEQKEDKGIHGKLCDGSQHFVGSCDVSGLVQI